MIRVFGGYIWAQGMQWFLPASTTPGDPAFVSKLESFTDITYTAGDPDTVGYLVWQCADDASLPGELAIYASASDVTLAMQTNDHVVILAELDWKDVTDDDFPVFIKQWTADTIIIQDGGWWSSTPTFGLTRTGNGKITVHNCKARRFGDPQGTSIYYTCGDVEVIFGADGTGYRIVWVWDATSGTPTLSVLADPQINDALDSLPIIRGTVAIFDVVNGIPRLAKGGTDQLGHPIILPLFTAPGV